MAPARGRGFARLQWSPRPAAMSSFSLFLAAAGVACDEAPVCMSVRPQLLKEAVESQRMCELMKQQEVHLKQQVRGSRATALQSRGSRAQCTLLMSPIAGCAIVVHFAAPGHYVHILHPCRESFWMLPLLQPIGQDCPILFLEISFQSNPNQAHLNS